MNIITWQTSLVWLGCILMLWTKYKSLLSVVTWLTCSWRACAGRRGWTRGDVWPLTYICCVLRQVSSDESERLIKMEGTLHQRVIGQEEAVVAISRAIRRARVGLKNPNRPIASFIFSGPTGEPCCRLEAGVRSGPVDKV